MTDYYPLISRAVAGLEKNSGEARRGLYERARTALVAQLRGLNPPLTESEITRERLALEESIRKVEAESARKTTRIETPPRASQRAAEAARRDETRRDENPLPSAIGVPAARRDGASPAQAATAEARQAPIPEPAASRTAPRLRFGERSQLSDEGLKGFRDVVAETETLGDATAQAGRTARQAFAAAVPSETPELDRLEPRLEPQTLPASLRTAPRDQPAPRLVDPRPADSRAAEAWPAEPRSLDARSEPSRPAEPTRAPEPPRPAEQHQPSPRQQSARQFPTRRLAIDDDDEQPRRSAKGVAAALLAVVLLLALGGAAYWQRDTLKNFFNAMRGQPTQQTQRGITPPPTVKNADRVGQPPAASQGPVAAVAQRVVLYEEDPADAAGKKYIGSAIWRTEMVSPGAGQPAEVAIRADLEIPERRVTMTMSIRRNTDQALPASHTVEIMFNLPADFPFGGVSNVPGILMKQAEQTRGAPLAGLAVKVTSGFFLVGLSAVETEMQRNMELLKERGWFDIPIVYNNGRRAILAIEKGTPGERAFTEAFAAWGK
jgi:hypothetical protein